nr:14776_t:CDS:10 [Entrophospora candida]
MPKEIQKTKKPIAAPYPAVPLKETNKNIQAPLKLNLSRIAHSGDVQLSDEQNQILNLAVNSHNSIFYTGSAATETELHRKIIKFKSLVDRWRRIKVLVVDEAMEENNNSYEKNENPNASNTRVIPTNFLDLLNNTLDDVDLVHLLAETSIKVIPKFTAATLTVAPHLWQNLEQEWSEFNQDLRLTSGIGPRNHALPPTLRAKVEANLHYVNRDYPKAIEVLQEVIKIDPNIHSAWFMLGTIQDEIGCLEKALQLYLVAAHPTPHDAIRYDPNDVGWSMPYAEIGEYKKAIDDAEAEGSFGYPEINITAELYMLINDFGSAIEFIKCGVRWLQGREDETCTRHQGVFSSGSSNAPLPLKLRLHLNYLKLYDVKQCIDLYYEVAETYAEKGLFEDALTIYEAILLNSETNNPNVWMRVGLYHRELENFENAAEYFTTVIEDSPDNLDAKISLAETYEFLGENELH